MKLVSFNVNGIRARGHQLQSLVESHQPDLIGIQETKVHDEQFPEAIAHDLGYHPYYHGQKGHFGVALFSREPLEQVQRGFAHDGDEAQRRLIIGQLDDGGQGVTVINGYFPNGESRDHPDKFPAKRRFYADLLDYLQRHHQPGDSVAVMGDFNISPTDADIGIGENNRKRWLREGKCSFLPEEREWFQALLDWGLTDSFRACHPDEQDQFSWFDYRSRGFERDPRRGLRIDGILTTQPLRERLREAWTDYDIRGMEKPSDHCPFWAEFA